MPRSRNFCAILYPDFDDTHRKALEFIRQNYDYACAEHDQDLEESGELKKKHTHVVFRFGNARNSNSVSVELGIKENYLQVCRNFNGQLRYLVHKDDPDKYQYDFGIVEGRLRPVLAKLLDGQKTEDEKVLAVIQLLDEIESPLNVKQFITIMAQNGLYSEVRRNGYMMVKVLDIHNQEVLAKQRETTT